MDTEGAGLATIISQIFSMVICVIYIAKKLDILHFEKTDIRLEADIVVKLVRLGLPIALTEGIISLGGIVMQFGTNSLGTMFITSHTTANKLSDFASMPLLSFSTAFAVFVGQNYGAKKLERIRDGIKKSLIISYCWCAILITIFIFFSEPLLRLLAGDIDAQILAYARQYLLIRSSFYVLLATLLIVKTTLQSLSRVLWPTISGFVEVFARAGISLLTVFLVTSQILNLDGGYTLICFANPLAWFTAILTMGFDFIKALKMLKNDNADLQK
jgi:Na+-driven multidrug efflux pump